MGGYMQDLQDEVMKDLKYYFRKEGMLKGLSQLIIALIITAIGFKIIITLLLL
jgi:hypothetical protein